jgi:hypothetical protein
LFYFAPTFQFSSRVKLNILYHKKQFSPLFKEGFQG